ncbi:N-acetylglucosamine-6-phosphate deacetylase [Amycolatopsis antarctica]|uniref:N-acetylglucosamine-6-phosphate deacetylase n=1 Tax=Amycolatopsis antarctica TaxID=1854586 RepID=A0A263CZZ5_9PSEU|nr:N-acetylglucosamine-6-phosphate deacetylase [Amycolatopsis antarctica]OZM71539.1 N-acetylglucosamine-6-phosphate deacetylase [Amycolatopsis antarctica]
MITGGTVAAPDALLADGWVAVENGLISAVGTGNPPAGEQVDAAGGLIVPGFVDTHCHGGGRGTFSTTDPGGISTSIRTHRRHGTTTMLASLVSEPVDSLRDQLGALGEFVQDGELAGVHLEGPFISAARCGAHDPGALREPDTDTVAMLLEAGGDHVRMMTLAPELHGGIKAIRQLAESGVIAAIGHTDGVEEEIRAGVDAGATVATHLFNGMRPLHHREPGPIGSLLDDERVTVELICDLVHVHPTVLRLAARHAGLGRTVLVTDAMSATGSAPGTYRLGELEVEVADGVARLTSNGSLAGSTLTMDEAFRNLVGAAGLDITEAVRATATRPAELLGLGGRTGALRAGLDADLVVLGEDRRPVKVLRRGAWVPDIGLPAGG